MTMPSKHRALWEWFAGCSEIAKLFFNFSGSEDGDTAIITAGDTLIEEYVDGAQKRRYAFNLVRFVPITFLENDIGNVTMAEELEAIKNWVESQNDIGDLPKFSNPCTAESVEVLDSYTGEIAAHNDNIAKYMMPFAITYIKERT